jgi:enoyl-CoA hydratase/carnithine racemase
LTEEDRQVLYELVDDVARLTIDRAERRNALSPAVVRGLLDGVRRADGEARVVVLTGAGDKAFCAGGDLGGMTDEGRVSQHFTRAEVGDLFREMRSASVPIVARVNGHALAGGFGLMLACDHVIAVDDADIGMPEINLGLWPFMISAVIQRDIPRKIALDLMLTGKRVSVREGERWGFVNRVVPRSDLDTAVQEFVDAVKAKSPLITALGKRSFYRAEDMGTDEALDYLAGMLTVALESEDTIEGVTAWLEKRKPDWKGR